MNPADAVEACLTVADISPKLKLSKDKVRRIFIAEPGVLLIGEPTRKVGRRLWYIQRKPLCRSRASRTLAKATLRRGIMELLMSVVEVLSPLELKNMKATTGLTLAELSRRSRVSMSQISEFSNGKNGIAVDQAQRVADVLLDAAQEKSIALAKLLQDAT